MQIFGRSLRFWRIAALFAVLVAAPTSSRANNLTAIEPPQDPLQIIISLQDQALGLYRGAALLDTSRVSTGKRRYRTPRGVYSILEKRRRHYSNLYGGAPMPYMQRITWSGLALHQGYVPRRPASHGCIRLPKRFARNLFGMTEIGASVIITQEPQTPRLVEHANLFMQRRPALFSDPPDVSETLATAAIPHTSAGADIVAAHYVAAATPASDRAIAKIETNRAAWARAFDIEMDADREVVHLAPKDKPVRVLILATANDTKMTAAQQMLATLGYDVGEVDGFFGRQTARAVHAFQTDQAMTATGTLDEETVEALYDASGARRPSGRLFIRQGYRDVFDMPLDIRDAKAPLGTHVYTAMAFEPAAQRGESVEVQWTAVTVDDADGAPGADAISALDRLTIPQPAREWIETMLRPGSTVIISDAGYGWETGKGTDFIVQPRQR